MLELDRVRKEAMEYGIKSCLSGTPKENLRVNVMVIRRRPFRRHFVMAYQHAMRGSKDATLHFPISEGFCGKVLKSRTQKPFYTNVKESPLPDNKWSTRINSEAEEVHAIVTVLLVREVPTFSGMPDTVYFGCLSVDATDNTAAEILQNAELQNKILDLARLAEIVFNS